MKIACLYTGVGLHNRIEPLLKQYLGEDVVFNHIMDSGIMRDIIADDGITPKTERRLLSLFKAAVLTEPDLVLCTCSSIGEVAEKAATLYPEVPIVRIDDAMARYAVEHYSRIAVMATLSTTVLPSCRLIERIAAQQGKSVKVVSATAEGAFPLLISGKPEEALERMKKTAAQLCGDADVLLLAQASMEAFAPQLHETTGVPVFTSPELCAKQLARLLKR